MTSALLDRRTQTLPPLILHPFAESDGPGKLLESSRANLMLKGLLPPGDCTGDELSLRLLEGRWCELRMLFYVGKDVIRWIDQCLEYVERQPEMRGRNYTLQSFASHLLFQTPALVRAKLRSWGVADYQALFGRALAINLLFNEAPERGVLSAEFVRNYYKYADSIFQTTMQEAFTEVPGTQFAFELYASGEYSKLLEQEWERAQSR